MTRIIISKTEYFKNWWKCVKNLPPSAANSSCNNNWSTDSTGDAVLRNSTNRKETKKNKKRNFMMIDLLVYFAPQNTRQDTRVWTRTVARIEWLHSLELQGYLNGRFFDHIKPSTYSSLLFFIWWSGIRSSPVPKHSSFIYLGFRKYPACAQISIDSS